MGLYKFWWREQDWIGWDNIFFSMLVTRKRKKLLGFVCVWKRVISENIHTSYTTDDFHILTRLPLPSEFPALSSHTLGIP